MAQQPRGRPPSQAPPPAGRGRSALTFLGGGVLVLAVAGGAVALFGRDDNKSTTTAIGPKVPTSAPLNPVQGPVVPGKASKPAVPVATATTVTSPRPVAATSAPAAAATSPSAPAPTKAAVATQAPTAAPTKAPAVGPAVTPPVAKPPVSAPQQGGTVAKKAYSFKVARGDTLWNITKRTLASTGRSTSNANVAAYVSKLYRSNSSVVGSNPNFILPGQTIVWPSGL